MAYTVRHTDKKSGTVYILKSARIVADAADFRFYFVDASDGVASFDIVEVQDDAA